MTRRELEITDIEQIRGILDTCKVLRLGLVDDGMPYVVPMNFGYTLEDGKLTLILHSGMKGYKLEVIRKNPVCCFEMDCDVQPFEGVVPCQYGTSYYSLLGRGKAVLVEDVDEKIALITRFMKNQTGKDFEFNEKLVSIVAMIRIDVDEFTAKHRPMPKVDVTKMMKQR